MSPLETMRDTVTFYVDGAWVEPAATATMRL